MDLENLASAAGECRSRWKGKSGRYPDQVWESALKILHSGEASVEDVASALNVRGDTVQNRLLNKDDSKAKVKQPSPAQFVELCGAKLDSSFRQNQKPQIVMRSRDGSELCVDLGDLIKNPASATCLIGKLVSCWVSAHR
jgi:hypothetical protein